MTLQSLSGPKLVDNPTQDSLPLSKEVCDQCELLLLAFAHNTSLETSTNVESPRGTAGPIYFSCRTSCVRRPVRESNFSGLTQQGGRRVFHGSWGGAGHVVPLQGGHSPQVGQEGAMVSKLCSPVGESCSLNQVTGGARRTHSVSALLLIFCFSQRVETVILEVFVKQTLGKFGCLSARNPRCRTRNCLSREKS